jgi:hypothetical protein
MLCVRVACCSCDIFVRYNRRVREIVEESWVDDTPEDADAAKVALRVTGVVSQVRQLPDRQNENAFR